METRKFIVVGASNDGKYYSYLMESDAFPSKFEILATLKDRYETHIPNFVSITEISYQDYIHLGRNF